MTVEVRITRAPGQPDDRIIKARQIARDQDGEPEPYPEQVVTEEGITVALHSSNEVRVYEVGA